MPQKYTYWRLSDELQKDDIFDEGLPKKIHLDIVPAILKFTGPIDYKPEMIYVDRDLDEYYALFRKGNKDYCLYAGEKDNMELTRLADYGGLFTANEKLPFLGNNLRMFISELIFYRRHSRAKKELILREEVPVKAGFIYLATYIKGDYKRRLEQIL